jgi:hypothetical protein
MFDPFRCCDAIAVGASERADRCGQLNGDAWRAAVERDPPE